MLKARGYKVRPVPSGKLALLAARKDPPDLILLDINMPEMDGYEVCTTPEGRRDLARHSRHLHQRPQREPRQGERVRHRRGRLPHQAVPDGRIAREGRDPPEAPPPPGRAGGGQLATGEGQRPDVARPGGGGEDPEVVPAQGGARGPGGAVRLGLPALRRAGRRRAEHHPPRRREDRPLRPGRQRPRRDGGPAVGDAQPPPLAAFGALLDPDRPSKRPRPARRHATRRGRRPPQPALPLRHGDRTIRHA